MEETKFVELSSRAKLAAVLGAMLVSMLSFGAIVVLYDSASDDLGVLVAWPAAAPAASSVAVGAPRKPKSG